MAQPCADAMYRWMAPSIFGTIAPQPMQRSVNPDSVTSAWMKPAELSLAS
jgi:hypothetical protein